MIRRTTKTTSPLDRIAQTWGAPKPTPVQWTPQYNTGAANAAVNNFSSWLSGFQAPNTDFSYQPVGWQSVTTREISAAQEADKALTFNESNLGRFMDMARTISQEDTTTKLAMLDRVNPGWTTQRDQAAAINSQMMRGEIPKDVQEQIAQTAAFQTVQAGGYGGPGNTRSVTARDLGMTSLDLMQAGQQGSMAWGEMLNSWLPQQTSGTQILAQSGLTARDTIETALSNADRRLTADMESARQKQTAAIQNANLSLQAASARSNELANFNNAQMSGRTNLLASQLDNVSNQYSAAYNASNINFGNQNRPYQTAMEFQGLLLGQNLRRGYGI